MRQTMQFTITRRQRAAPLVARPRLVPWGLLVISATIGSRPSFAQIMVAAPYAAAQPADQNAPKLPFNPPAQKSEVAESLADFNRLAAKGTWERAFKSLEKVQAADPNTLTPAAEGLFMPTRLVVRQALTELSPAGKQAYRLFHDAEAKALFEQAQGKDELEKLRKVYTDHFITSSGDVAADRLGDVFFEQGEMDKAAECWLAVLRWRPESALPRVRLLVKSAIALARGDHWDSFAELSREVRQRHADETVVVGGQTVPAVEHLAAFEKKNRSAPPSAATAVEGAVSVVHLPDDVGPAWQFRVLPHHEASAVAQAGMNWGWNTRFPVTEMVPAAAHDGNRLYLNYLGYLMAIDLQSGKLLWRSARLADLGQKMQRGQYHYPEQYGVAVAGDALWCVTRDVGQIGQHGQPFRVGRWEAATGKAGWNSQNIGELQQWNFMGTPLAAGDRVYLAAAKNGQGAELYALALQATDGKLLWATHLGTHQSDPTQMWHRRGPQPSLLAKGGKLYIDTHAGALVALDAAEGAIDWAFAYDSSVPDNNMWYNQPAAFTTASPPIIFGNVLYLKGMRSDRLYALDLSGPKLVWKRPVGEAAMLVGVDDETIYLSGDEVLAIKLSDQKLKWASRLPHGTGWIRPLLTADRFYQFTSRGIFELDKTNGDTVRLFRGGDLDSLGGVLMTTPQRLVSVSNIAVTAYAAGAAKSGADASQAPAGSGGK